MFEPFNRGEDEKLIQGKEGFGIGLAIAHKLAVLMAGGIELQSTVGVGSRFTVLLPLAMFALAAT